MIAILAMANRCCSPAGQRRGLPVGQVGIPRLRKTASMRSSIAERGTPRFSSPKASSSRTVSFELDSWSEGDENTMPHRPIRSAAGAISRSTSSSRDVARDRRSDHPRQEPGGGQGERRLAGARPAGEPDPFAVGDLEGHVVERRARDDRDSGR